MTTQFREVHPFPPPGDYPRESSGMCLACGAVVIGGIVRDLHGQHCPACEDDFVVGMPDHKLAECVELVAIQPATNGRR
jgi:hypothetical protein